jgi:hypothetical protein
MSHTDQQQMLIHTLETWNHATDIQRLRVKKQLMPEDDVDTLFFKVTTHPDWDDVANCAVMWFCEIEVYDANKLVCTIIVETRPFDIIYHWHVGIL